MRSVLAFAALAGALTFAAVGARADDYTLTIKNHLFTPSEITVPANQRVTLIVVNGDATPEEFESHAMKVEKVISGNSSATVRIGPLPPGRYPFVGEFHEESANGTLVAQ